jgi:hypothetical protein
MVARQLSHHAEARPQVGKSVGLIAGKIHRICSHVQEIILQNSMKTGNHPESAHPLAPSAVLSSYQPVPLSEFNRGALIETSIPGASGKTLLRRIIMLRPTTLCAISLQLAHDLSF